MSTKYNGTDDEKRALDCFIKLARCSERINHAVRTKLRRLGISVSQFGILEALYFLGPMCQSRLADKLLKTGANITTVIDNLEKKEMLRRVRDPADRRYYSIVLTDKGREWITGVFPDHAAYIRSLFSVLSTEEQERLQYLLKKLGRSV